MITKDLSEYFIKLAKKSLDVFWIRSKDFTTVMYVSPSYEEIWGRTCESLYQHPEQWFHYLHSNDYEQVMVSINQCGPDIDPSKKFDCVYRIIRPDGTIRWIHDTFYGVYSDQAAHIGFVGVARDITQEKELEENLKSKLQAASQFLPKLAERMEKSVFWVRDASLREQLYISSGYEKIWGRSAEDLYKNPSAWGETVLPEDRKHRTVADMLNLLEKYGKETRYEDLYRIKRPDDTIRWIKDTSFPIYDENGTCIGFAGIAEDLTKEKQYEQELRAAKERAEIANEAKSEFILNMSHDLRTPLNGILGFTQYLAQSETDPTKKDMLNDVFISAKSLLGFLNEVLELSNIESGEIPIKCYPFNLFDLISRVISLLMATAKNKNLALNIHYHKELPHNFIGDEIRIHRILLNLISNAIKFTAEGQITITVELLKETEDTSWINLIVKDTGIGVPADKVDIIFERFSRVSSSYKGQYEGAGLGLYIAKTFINDLGGEIKIKSEENIGTIFTCTIPFKKV